MTSFLEPILRGELPPGRYRLDASGPLRSLQDEVIAAGWTVCVVDGAAMTDRASLFAVFAAACEFPDWFGRNWDAFADCLEDLSWLPDQPIAVFWQRSEEFAAVDPDTWTVAGRVIDAAIAGRIAAGSTALVVIYPMVADITGDQPALRPEP